MGIRCLTTFVKERFTRWEKGPIHGELIIDGCSLYYEFIRRYDDELTMYGGDYISLGKDIENFLVTLVKCNIKPFLIFDGTVDERKHDTLVTRTHEKLETAVAMTAERTSESGASSNDGSLKGDASNQKRTVEPFLGSDVMINKVKHVLGGDCLFVADGDADIDIACLAIHRRCPVLSNDSDFYIFPLQYGYILYSKFQWSDPRNDKIYDLL